MRQIDSFLQEWNPSLYSKTILAVVESNCLHVYGIIGLLVFVYPVFGGFLDDLQLTEQAKPEPKERKRRRAGIYHLPFSSS